MTVPSIVDLYRKEVYRIGWKLQYQAKVIYRREVPILSDSMPGRDPFQGVDTRLYALQLIESLPTDTERFVLREIYLHDKTEAQVARELQISQQAVSKWKRKAIRNLSRTGSS